MHGDGLDAHYVNLVDENDAPFYQFMFGGDVGNPQALPNVRNCWLHGQVGDPHPELARLITALDPQVMVGFGPANRIRHRHVPPSPGLRHVGARAGRCLARPCAGQRYDTAASGQQRRA
jgi:hypothetical protein